MISKHARACWGLAFVFASALARADQVDDYIADKMKYQHIPGLSLVVLKAGKPVKTQGYGLANLELRTPVTPETVFKIGSLSKQFISAGIVILNADGKVGYEDSVRKYLDDAPVAWQPITVRQLMTHSAGLVREAPGFEGLKIQSDADTIRSAYGTPLAYAPGEDQQYSNLGYFILAEIITRASQKPWPQFIDERIFKPLGMNATRTTTETLVPNRANAYDYVWASGVYKNAENYLALRPSGAFLSTVVDLGKWDAALYTDKPFTLQQRELMWAPVKLKDGTYKPYGFGWVTNREGKHRHVQHAGTLNGFRAQISRFVDDQLSVIVLANSAQALPENIALHVAAFYIPDLMPSRKQVKVRTEVLDSYTGRYEGNGLRTRIITRRGDSLALSVVVDETRPEVGVLRAVDETNFFNEDDTRNTFTFWRDGGGPMQFASKDPEGKVLQQWERKE